MNISVEVPDAEGKQLQEVADRLKVQAEQLVSAALRDLLANAEADFEHAATRVVEKNKELYKRLA